VKSYKAGSKWSKWSRTMRGADPELGSYLGMVREYYTKRFQIYGSMPADVDWNSVRSQELRLEYLPRIRKADVPFSKNDYGCGYGTC